MHTTFVDESDLADTPTTDETTAEVVVVTAPPPPPTAAALERRDADAAALEAVTLMPGSPGRDEFISLAMQARILSMSGAAPKAIRESPHLALHVAMIGRDLGISASASLELIDIIPGKRDQTTNEVEYRLSLSPQLLNGQLRRLGLGSIRPAVRTDRVCVAVALAPGGHVDPRCTHPEHRDGCECRGWLGVSEFSWEQARRADLVGPNCTPDEHKKDQSRGGGQRTWMVCGCNQGYITYPERMLWWRASGFAADDYFPEAGLGLYSPEALGSMVDEEGRAIDPSTVELPEGYGGELPAAAAPLVPTEIEWGDPSMLWDLQREIRALPNELRSKLAQRWKDSGKLTYVDDSGKRSPYRVHELPAAAVASAQSMVHGFVQVARKADPEWTLEAATKRVDAELCTVLIPWLCTRGHVGAAEPAPVSASAPASASASDDASGPAQSAESDPAPDLPPDERSVYVRHVRDTLNVIDDQLDAVTDDDALAVWETLLHSVDVEHVDVEHVDEIIEQVKGMPSALVRVWLSARSVTVPRGPNDARQALAERLLRERAVESDEA